MHAARSERPTALEEQRRAYNHAFEELGLGWHWDENTHRDAPEAALGPQGVREYLHAERPHLLRAYDADFLIEAIENAKRRYLEPRSLARTGA